MLGEHAIVREQEQPFGVGVESPDMEETLGAL
jgi:hypothetical protein